MGLAISRQHDVAPRRVRDPHRSSRPGLPIEVPYLRLVGPIDERVPAPSRRLGSPDRTSEPACSSEPDCPPRPDLRIASCEHPVPRQALRRTLRPTPVRLTRRGRIVVWLLLLGSAIVLLALLAPASQAAAPAGPPRAVTVHPGDTMWSIATAALPGDSPTVAMARIRALNHLATNEVYVGEQVLLPPANS